MTRKHVYRISYFQQDELHQIYAKKIAESEMFGFLEVEQFIFSSPEQLVVDPAEERLAAEYADIKRRYIPMHAIMYIDEVAKEGIATIKPSKAGDNIVSAFPPLKKSKPRSD